MRREHSVEGGILPSGYTQLAYIQSTGTQYINTGYAFVDDYFYEIDFDGISSLSTLFGGRTSSIRTAIVYNNYNENTGMDRFVSLPIAQLNGGATPFRLTDLNSGRHTILARICQNAGHVELDGITYYNHTVFSGNYISGVNQTIFADNFGNGVVSEFCRSKLYLLRMGQGNGELRHFIPAMRSDNVVGLYDIIGSICPLTNTPFYTNAGTGTFLYGTL